MSGQEILALVMLGAGVMFFLSEPATQWPPSNSMSTTFWGRSGGASGNASSRYSPITVVCVMMAPS